jgi:hypothetical protein
MENVGISSKIEMMLRPGLVAVLLVGCSSNTTPQRPVLAAPPPQDDGRPSEGGAGGAEHAAALEQLKTAPMNFGIDRQNAIKIPLPDSPNWMRVKFWGVKSLVGYRYGKEHHAIVAGFVTQVPDNAVPGACVKSFESWAMEWIRAFDVELERDPPMATMWKRIPWPNETEAMVPVPIEIEGDFAKTATLLQKESYAGAWAAYPAWRGRCLIVGVAVPSRDNDQRAKDVRDRFIREVLPKVEILSAEEPLERY